MAADAPLDSGGVVALVHLGLYSLWGLTGRDAQRLPALRPAGSRCAHEALDDRRVGCRRATLFSIGRSMSRTIGVDRGPALRRNTEVAKRLERGFDTRARHLVRQERDRRTGRHHLWSVGFGFVAVQGEQHRRSSVTVSALRTSASSASAKPGPRVEEVRFRRSAPTGGRIAAGRNDPVRVRRYMRSARPCHCESLGRENRRRSPASAIAEIDRQMFLVLDRTWRWRRLHRRQAPG